MRQPLLIATRNTGKLVELQELLKDYAVTIKTLEDFGPLPQVAEDGETFEANAYLKASSYARMTGLPTLADDSGLTVGALSGAPGVHSARYGGEGLTDQARCEVLLEALQGQSQRQAAFECVISIAVPTGAALTYQGHCEGLIVEILQGTGGFGYDPVFYYPPLHKTFAEMTRAEKNAVSHRGRALMEVRQEFDKILKWIDLQMPVEPRFRCKED